MRHIFCKNIQGVNLLGYESFQKTYQPKINSFDYDYIHEYILNEYESNFFKNKIEKSESYFFGIASIKIVLFLSNFIFDNLLTIELEEQGVNLIAGAKLEKLNIHEIDNNAQIYSQFEFKIGLKRKFKSYIKNKISNENLLFNKRFLFSDNKLIFIGKKNNLISDYYSKKKIEEVSVQNDVFIFENKKLITNELLSNYDDFFYKIRKKFNHVPNYRFDHIFQKIRGYLTHQYKIMMNAFEFAKNQNNQIVYIHAIGHPVNRAIAAGYRLANREVVATVHGNMDYTLRKTVERVTYSEFGIVTKLICTSNIEAEFAKKIIKDMRHVYFQSDVVIYEQKSMKDKIVNKTLLLKKEKKHKNIMIMGYPHKNSFSAGQPDLNWRDRIKFEINLIRKIKSHGYNVTYKCHPDRTLGTVDLMNNIADEVIIKKFELCFQNYQNIIFTYAATTAFGFALSNNIPSILINFSTSDLNSSNIKLIENKCSIINLFFDKNGHESLDKIDLNKFIKEAKELSQK